MNSEQVVLVLSNYFKSGGTDSSLVVLISRAKEMSRMGHFGRAGDGQVIDAHPRQPSPDGGHLGGASNGRSADAPVRRPVEGGEATHRTPQGHLPVASSPSPQTSGGHRSTASQSRPAPAPAREPTAAQINAVAAARRLSARNILYRCKTGDGKWWGDVRPYEVQSMSCDHIRGAALMSVLGALNPKQMRMTFAELMTPDQAQIAMDQAEKRIANVA